MPLLATLPSGAFTLSGKTSGPAVALGRNRYRKSQLMFMHEDELRKAVHAAGWPLPETHADVAGSLETVTGERDVALEERDQALAKAATLEAALRALGADVPEDAATPDSENGEPTATDGEPTQPVELPEPPKPKANKGVWEKYAADNGIEIPADATKAQIVEAVTAARNAAAA